MNSEKNGNLRKEKKEKCQNSENLILKKVNEQEKNEISKSNKTQNTDFMNSFWVFPIQQSTWPMSYINYKDNSFLNYSLNTVVNWS